MTEPEFVIEPKKDDSNTASINNETVLTKNQIPVSGTTLVNNLNDFGGQADIFKFTQ